MKIEAISKHATQTSTKTMQLGNHRNLKKNGTSKLTQNEATQTGLLVYMQMLNLVFSKVSLKVKHFIEPFWNSM